MTEHDDVAAEREFLERSLADLEAERAAGDIADDDYALLRDKYRARLGALSAPASAADRATGASGVGKKVGIAAAVVALAIGSGLLVAQFAGSRDPGETITGGVPERASTPSDPETAQLERAAELAAAGDVLGALEVYDEILAEDPASAAALTYKGWLLRNVGGANDEPELSERGVALLEQASQVDPTFSEAWLFLGIVYYRDQDDPDRAVDALRLALANDPIPDVEAAARELLAEIDDAT